jgi:hypothetical protein
MPTTTSYDDHYTAKLAEGAAFEFYIYEQFLDRVGIEIVKLPRGQHNLGENYEGIEVKYDAKMHSTGNVYVEVAEKSHPSKPSYFPSGVMRADNTHLVCIGNYKEAFLFGKAQLVALVNERPYRYVQKSTSLGYLMPLAEAREHAEMVFRSEG